MMERISLLQEPQLVPALSAAPTASAVWQPLLTASVMLLIPTWKQAQMMAPPSGRSSPGRPARTSERRGPSGASASSDTAHCRDTSTGSGDR